MLKKFFSNVLSTFVGAWLALAVFSATAVVMSFAILGSFEGSSSTATVQENSVLHLNMIGNLNERPSADDALNSLLAQGEDTGTNLETVLKAISIAKDNQKIKGIFMEDRKSVV